MDLLDAFLYFYILLVGAFAIINSYGFTRSYKFSYLLNYFHFMISFNILGLLIFVLIRLCNNDLWKSVLVIFPIIIISLYFFISFLLSLIEKRMSAFQTIFLYSFSSIVYIGIILFKGYLIILFDILIMSIILIIFVLYFYIIYGGLRGQDLKRFKVAKALTNIYSVSIIVLLITFLFHENSLSVFQIFFFFLINVYPMVYLKNFLSMNYIDHLLINDKTINFEKFFKKFKISDREKEIAKLLAQGKSNKEIEDSLYISLKTVKNHIYNIYKKTNVNRRIQLVNLITKYKK